ncbi:MAG TPA: TonB-dependent siderophore receptor [Burkholderiales bacterium]|nr:TonB-dependent siderophore receptor [Burkholderiales bacterium]
MERFKRRPLAAALLVAFSGPDWALAQSQTEQPREQTLPEVRVRGEQEGFRTESTGTATRTETPMRDIPQFINTVPQDVIRSQGATTLGDALRNVPGISYAAPEGGTQANNVYYLRGFPAGGDLFLDGVRDIGEYNRDLFNIEQVEVLKGPSSLMFGRGSTGGIIHQVSKTPGLLPIREVALELGSDSKKRLTGDLNVKTGDASAFRLNALVEDSDYYRYPQGQEKVGVAPSFRFGIGGQTDVTLGYYYLKTKDVTDYGQPTVFRNEFGFRGFWPNADARTYFGLAQYDRTEHETNMATARIDHRFSSTLSLRETLRWASYKRDVEATIPSVAATDINGNPVTATTPTELLQLQRQHDKGRTKVSDDDVLISQTELTWKVATGAVKHTVLGGLELAREKLNRHSKGLDADPSSVALQAPIVLTPLVAGVDPNVSLSFIDRGPFQRALSEAETFALYAQDQLEFSPQWKALFGLRWEYYSAEARTEDASGVTPGNNTGPFSRTDKMLSGRAGLIWQPTTAQSYSIAAGNSYNPSGELGVYGATGTNLNATNQDLDPEENRNYEVGSQWDWRQLTLRSSIFRNEKINARMVDDTGTTVLEGKRRVDGIELQLAGHITPNWDVIAAIAWMSGEIVKSNVNQGNRPLGVPTEAGSLWTVYRLGGGWEVGGGAFWSQEKWMNDGNTAQLPEYTSYDATVAYVQKQYEIRLNFVNLTDEFYYYGAYNNSPSRVLPAAPRQAFLTMRYNF